MKRAVFFVHVMKTGGTSVGALLRTLCPEDRWYPPPGPDAKLDIQRLLDLSTTERSQLQACSVHMPAWVAAAACPHMLRTSVLREPVGRTVSHLRHIARNTGARSLAEVYDDTTWRDRLTNYQTRVFSQTEQDHLDLQAAFTQAIIDREEPPANRHDAAPEPNERPFSVGLYTALANPRCPSGDDLALALETVDAFDLVGITDALPAFVDAMGALLGHELGPVPRRNAASDGLQPDPALVDRIRRDNALDEELYRHAARAWV